MPKNSYVVVQTAFNKLHATQHHEPALAPNQRCANFVTKSTDYHQTCIFLLPHQTSGREKERDHSPNFFAHQKAKSSGLAPSGPNQQRHTSKRDSMSTGS